MGKYISIVCIYHAPPPHSPANGPLVPYLGYCKWCRKKHRCSSTSRQVMLDVVVVVGGSSLIATFRVFCPHNQRLCVSLSIIVPLMPSWKLSPRDA